MLRPPLIFLAALCCALPLENSLGGTLELNAGMKRVELTEYLEILRDPSGKLSIDDVRIRGEFSPLNASTLNLGITSDACWVRSRIRNNSDDEDWVLEVAYPPLDFIDLYVESEDGTLISTSSGDRVPFAQRYVSFRNANFEVTLPPNQTLTLWLRVQTSSALQVPLELFREVEFAERISTESFGFGLYYGLLLMVLAFNVVLASMTRDTIYVGYIGYLLSYLIFQLSLNGYLFEFILNNEPAIANGLLLFSFFLAVVGALTFTRLFLELSINFPPADLMIKGASYFCLLGGVAAIFLDYSTLIAVAAPIGVVFPVLILIAGVHVWRQGHSYARLFVVAWSCFLLGCIIFGLRSLGILPANAFTLYAIQGGSTLEVLLLTVAVGERITRLRAERDVANDALSDSYALLDEEVLKRNRLRDEVTALRQEIAQTSDQLVSADRLATLGMVLAGIAHDIANPSSLIFTRSLQLRDLATDTEEFLDTLIGDASDPESREVKAEFKLLFERMKSLSKEVELAALQINGINSAIRNQAREDDWTANVELEEIVDECLVILTLVLSDIEVVRRKGDGTSLTCSRSKIGQVIMNLVKNAADSINSGGNGGTIIIATERRGDDLLLHIEDSGVGIDSEALEKVFDVFYTTKKVGQGTGLGLAIVSRIVGEHGGYIEAGDATELEGARFSVHLPVERTTTRNGIK